MTGRKRRKKTKLKDTQLRVFYKRRCHGYVYKYIRSIVIFTRNICTESIQISGQGGRGEMFNFLEVVGGIWRTTGRKTATSVECWIVMPVRRECV